MYEDITYETDGRVAIVTLDRPDRMNAIRAQTIDELTDAFQAVWADRSLRCIILTGSGDRAFCVGGDVKQKRATGDYGPSRTGRFDLMSFQRLMREVPQPVIAAVNGLAIGGGHVLHVLSDLSIAASHARFGQAGPRTGSFDAGFGSAFLARVVGEKRAREIWYLCHQYSAEEAERWGLVNKVVPLEDLRATALEWANEIAAMSPTAIRVLKHSFNADTEHQAGLSTMAKATFDLYAPGPEAAEGVTAFLDKRPPDFPDPKIF